MPALSINISGSQDLERRLHALGEEMMDFSDGMRQIGEDFTQYYADKPFASQGGVYGKRWEPLNPEYAIDKARRYAGTGTLILVRTGEMRRSFRFKSGRDFATIENTAPYFDNHQNGRGVPQRVVMAVNGALKQIAKDDIQKDIERKIRRTMR